MTQFNLTRVACVAALWLIALASLSTTLAAQSTKVEGLIKARNGGNHGRTNFGVAEPCRLAD